MDTTQDSFGEENRLRLIAEIKQVATNSKRLGSKVILDENQFLTLLEKFERILPFECCVAEYARYGAATTKEEAVKYKETGKVFRTTLETVNRGILLGSKILVNRSKLMSQLDQLESTCLARIDAD